MRVYCHLHNVYVIFALLIVFSNSVEPLRHYTKKDIKKFREEVREMFQHAYQGYLTYASGYDELRPLSCDGVDTWGSYSLTLIDALDTLAVMGNYSEFKRVVGILTEKIDFDRDINVSVFETNIRIVGGLLSAHLMSHKAGLELEPGWPCNGPLLRLAEDVARRLLPAFDTNTGMPYGTVNLRHGVPPGETPITCTAGVGTFIVEFGALSRLTGDPIYEEVALNALYALWKQRSPIGLFGNHIDVQTGRWTAQDAGIGAGVDSYFEYLVKGAVMLNRPDLLEMFHEARKAIDKYMKRDDWYVWVSMNKGQVTLPVFQSLEAYWPGVLSLIGDTNTAKRIFLNYHSIWKQYGFLPEFYNIPNGEAGANRENYPLRPELIEAAMYLYRSTEDPVFLEAGVDILYSIQYSARTPCGYATIKNVRTHRKEDRMESFFLAETTKYLYLLFDTENYLHNDGHKGIVYETPNGVCVIEAGGFIFNTEAHPIDPAALKCCHDLPQDDMFKDFRIEDYYEDGLNFASDEDKEEFGCPEKAWRKDVEDMIIDIEAVIDPSIPSGEKISADHFKTENYSGSGDSSVPKKNHKKHSAVWKQLEKLLDQIPAKNTGSELTSLLEQDGTEIIDLIKFLMKNIKVKSLSNRLLDLLETSEASESIEGDKPILNVFEENERLKLIFEVLDEIVQNETTENHKTDMNDAVRSMARILSLMDQSEEQNLNKSDSSALDIMRKAQLRYEHVTSHPIRMLAFLLETHGLGAMDRKVVKKILDHTRSTDLMKSLTYPEKLTNIKIRPEYFEQVQAIVAAISVVDEKRGHLKVNLQIKTEDENISDSEVKAKTHDKDEDINSRDKASNDDIIVIDNKIHIDEDIGVGTIEQIDLKSFGDNLLTEGSESADKSGEPHASEHIKPTTSIHSQPPVVDEGTESLISDFVQTVLKTAFPPKPKFEPQLLLEKIRAKGDYMNYSKKYELLTCKAQPFLQRFSKWGQVY